MERMKLNAVMDFIVFNLLAPRVSRFVPRARAYMNEIGENGRMN